MPSVCVRLNRSPPFRSPFAHAPCSSVYQDIQMYSIEQFIELSPSEAHSEDVLSDEHQLMLNRLGFELVERQRFNEFLSATVGLTHAHFARLDRKVKELAQEKEEVIKTSKSQAATTESVKMQIEALLKVSLRLTFLSQKPLICNCPPRPRQKSARRSRSLFLILQTHPMRHPCRVNIPILGVFSHTFRIFPILYRPLWGSITNYMQTVMNLMDTKYNLRRRERTEIMACPG